MKSKADVMLQRRVDAEGHHTVPDAITNQAVVAWSHRLVRALLLVLSGLLPFAPALAATAPSTGTIFQQSRPAPAQPVVPGSVLSLPSPKLQRSHSAARIPIKRVRIQGNTLLPAGKLSAMARSVEGRTVTLGALDGLASRISDAYHAAGYPLAYAYVPAQRVRDGVVILRVIEPHYDRIALSDHTRLRRSMVRRTLGTAVAAGQPIAEAPLSRALLLLERTPGVRVAGTLVPGAKPATSTLQLTLSGEPIVRGSVSVDDYGNDYTGRTRGTADMSVGNPFGYGSQLAVNALTTSGGLLHAEGFSLLTPDLWRGMRAGVYGSRTIYHLGGAFQALRQSGRADQIGVDLSYPVLLQPGQLLSMRLDLLRNGFEQRSATAGTDDRSHIYEARLSANGAYVHWGGVTSGGVNLIRGILSLDSTDALQADLAGPNARGPFWVGQFRLARSQALPQQLQLQATLSGQLASRNLDGSEKFYLGGPDGVMSYPVGEAGGDKGWLLRLRLSHGVPLPLPGDLQAAALLQTGMVWANETSYAGFSGSNQTRLAGAGVGIDYRWRHRVSARLSYVHELGGTLATAGPDHGGELWASLQVNL